jgi:ribosome maturation factor RimP
MAAIDSLKPVIEEKLASMGFELYELKFIPAGPGSVLRVFIDREGGVKIADCESVSNELSMLLDVENFCSSRYRLEVSSPGADRVLKTERDFRRTAGRMVCVQAVSEDGKERPVTGTVESCENGILKLKSREKSIDIPISAVKYGKIEFSFK